MKPGDEPCGESLYWLRNLGVLLHADINQFIYGRFQSNQETNIFVLASYLSIQA
jgi:hypothetical protein